MNKNLKKKICLVLYVITTIIGVAFAIYKLLTVQTNMQKCVAITTLLVYVITLVYIMYASKRPQNDFLRYVMLIYSISLTFDLNYCIYLEAKHFFIVTVITMVLIAYISGSLERAKESRILCVVVTLALLYLWLNTSKNSGNIVNTSFSQLLLWINLRFAYNAHFVARKELSDHGNK